VAKNNKLKASHCTCGSELDFFYSARLSYGVKLSEYKKHTKKQEPLRTDILSPLLACLECGNVFKVINKGNSDIRRGIRTNPPSYMREVINIRKLGTQS